MIFYFLLAALPGDTLNFMIMMSKHLQLYHAACADRPIITPLKF